MRERGLVHTQSTAHAAAAAAYRLDCNVFANFQCLFCSVDSWQTYNQQVVGCGGGILAWHDIEIRKATGC